MKKPVLFLFVLLVCLSAFPFSGTPAFVHSSHDSIRISLLTCGPGGEIYSLFGHTAIRCQNLTQGYDIVYNYGLFSFQTRNFALRFALGEPDYALGIQRMDSFEAEYEYFNRSVWQQTLQLTNEEALRLMNLLEDNYRPENRIYRYNIFYDNCATRPRDKIEEAVSGNLVYPDSVRAAYEKLTFRDIMHEFTKGHSWARFGFDFCIGAPADRTAGFRAIMFAPFYLRDAFHSAVLSNGDGTFRNLVKEESQIVFEDQNVDCQTDWLEIFSPAVCFTLLLAVLVVLSCCEYKLRKQFWWIDMLLFALAGLCGCVITFLMLFSQHPAVSPNYLILVFHPFHLLWVPFLTMSAVKREKNVYHLYNIIVLTFFIVLFWLFPQKINFAVVPLALCLLLRSLMNRILCISKHEK